MYVRRRRRRLLLPAVVGFVRHLHDGLRDDVAGSAPHVVHRIHFSGVLRAGGRQYAWSCNGQRSRVIVVVGAAAAVAVARSAAEVTRDRRVVPEAAEEDVVPGTVRGSDCQRLAEILLADDFVRVLERLEDMLHAGPLGRFGVEAGLGDDGHRPHLFHEVFVHDERRVHQLR